MERFKIDSKHSEWTQNKELEHEITRRKMKKLLKRKRRKILSYSPPCPSPGSIIQSPDLRYPSLSRELSKKQSGEETKNTMITENQLKGFFEPPETLEEMERMKKELTLPPSNMGELYEVKARRETLLKTICRVCGRKLHITEQQIVCVCSYSFCKKQRKPGSHFCNIDLRQINRSKIRKENPRTEDNGFRKGKTPKKY